MTIVAVANQKGGVGKTTTAVTLAHGAALKGWRVLIIDLDPQGNVADALGLPSGNELNELLMGNSSLAHLTWGARPKLEVIRADKQVAQLKLYLTTVDFRERVIAKALRGHPYDLVVLDCAPSVDVLHTAALVAADLLMIPTRMDQFAIKGVAETVTSLAAVRAAGASSCRIGAVIPTMYDRVTRESQEQLINLAGAFGKQVWPPVMSDVACRVAARAGKTLWEMRRSRALAGYEAGLSRLMDVA